MGCGMFCLDGEIVFTHAKHVNQIGFSTLILVVTCGYYTRTDNVFPPYLTLALRWWPPLELQRNRNEDVFIVESYIVLK